MKEGWLDHLDWECRVGDLFELEVQAIAIPVNVVLNLHYRLGRHLAQRCGSAAHHEDLQRLRTGLQEAA